MQLNLTYDFTSVSETASFHGETIYIRKYTYD